MTRLLVAALALIGLIAAMLAANGLPWKGRVPDRLQAHPPVPAPRLLQSPAILPPAESDSMASLTRTVLRDLRRAQPGPGDRLQALARMSDGMVNSDARIQQLREEAAWHAPAALVLTAPLAVSQPVEPVPVGTAGDDALRPMGRRHLVAPGETLTTIAERLYGRASVWAEIYALNRDRLDRPDVLPAGIALRLP